MIILCLYLQPGIYNQEPKFKILETLRSFDLWLCVWGGVWALTLTLYTSMCLPIEVLLCELSLIDWGFSSRTKAPNLHDWVYIPGGVFCANLIGEIGCFFFFFFILFFRRTP